MKQFKISPSQCGKIMGTLKMGSITPKQKELIKTLEAKDSITENQQKELDRLKNKRDQPPELPEGAKTHCRQWFKENRLYYRRGEVTSKQMERGNISESDSIQLAGEYIGDPLLFKNEETLENDYMIGTYDTKTDDTVIDVKTSWCSRTFPILEKKIDFDYEYQLDCYMELTGLTKAQLIYCLIDMPESLREAEAKRLIWNGMDEADAYKKMLDYHTYTARDLDDADQEEFDSLKDVIDLNEKQEFRYNKLLVRKNGLPLELRIKAHEITYDKERIDSIVRRVKLCRDYIKELEKNG